MSHIENNRSKNEINTEFAHAIRVSVSSGEISGAVAAVATGRLSQVQAFGFSDQATQSSMMIDTIFRVGSKAKTIFTTAALVLLDDKRFRLDDKITKWIPELADRRVLRTPNSEIDDTVPAHRDITVFDVLTFQLGIGIYLAQQDTPFLRAMRCLSVGPLPELVPIGPDEFISRLGSLPLAHHPGETFMYHTGDDVLRVLISRIARQPLGELLQERVFKPLAMVDSGLYVPKAKQHRLSTCYWPQANSGKALTVWDTVDNRFAKEPVFPNSIVSTANDYLNLSQMLLGRGAFQGQQFLSTESVALMMTDHLSDEQKRRSPAGGFWQNRGWGMGASIYTRSIAQGPNVGSYSWFGGYGGHYVIDPKRGSTIVSMVPRMMVGAKDIGLGYQFEFDTYRDILSADVV